MRAQTADDIIEKHLQALGGKAKIAEVKTLLIDGTIPVAPGLDIPFKMSLAFGKGMRMEVEFQGKKQIVALNGDMGWKIDPFSSGLSDPDPEPLPADMVTEMKPQLDQGGDLYEYKAKGNKVEYVGKEDVEGTECYKLKVTRTDGITIFYLIDTETNYDIKIIQKVKLDDKETESTSLKSDFRPLSNGYIMAFNVNNEGQIIQFTKAEINPIFDAKLFEMPAKK
ncbi:MAG: hypothetical protein ABIV51_02335 [Saprospiraceae bacterium]